MDINQAAQDGKDTAQRMLLEFIWEALLNLEADPVAAAERVSAVILKTANDAPHTEKALSQADGEYLELVRHHTLTDLEQFWDHVRMKLVLRQQGA